MDSPSIRLHRFALSGHCHRVELLLSLLELPFTTVDVDLAGGEHKRAPFLAKNPWGQVPVLDDGPLTIADSQAILVYLAARYDPRHRWLPEEPAGRARVQQWMSIAAGPLAHGPAAARMVRLFGAPYDYDRAIALADPLFTRMESVLKDAPFLAEGEATLADVAMYAYTAHAPEGGIALTPYPAVVAWLQRVEALPRFVAMRRSASHVAV